MKRITLYTKRAVKVDSVWASTWVEGSSGITELLETDLGVQITWLKGGTVVPWSNIICLEYVK